MKIYIACFVLLTTLQCYSQNLKLNWHKHIQGLGESNVRAQKLTIDKDGNILMSIRFKDSVYCFEKKYYSLGRYYNALLVTKVDKEGNYLWDVSLKSYTSINEITGLDTDNNGNIYVTGLTGPDTMRVNDSLIAYDLSNPINGFLICLDSEGTVKWTKAYQGTRDFFRFEPTDLVFDKQSGGIIVAGKSFGKGQIGDIQIDNGVGFHTVLLKHGPDGNFSNAYIIADNGDYDSDIALDKDGNILMATSFDTKITLQDQEFTTLNDLSDAILIKFDPDCQLLWARQGGGFLYDYGIKCAVDDEGNCYL